VRQAGLLVIFALAALAQISCGASLFQCTDLSAPRAVDYLVVSADALAGACDELLAHRQAQGLRTAEVTLGEVSALRPQLPPERALTAFLQQAHDAWGVRFVLLVGDAAGPAATTIPMHLQASGFVSPQFPSEPYLATDYPYSLPQAGAAQIHVGRFPADDVAQATQMAARTVAYERDLLPGPWQAKLALITGVLGYSPVVDQVVETLFRQTVVQDVPPAFEVEVAQARPDSPYCPYPPSFSDNALRMLNDGSLLYVYVGHGAPWAFDDFSWQGRSYPIFDAAAVDRVSVSHGLPLMVVLACSTGRLDDPDADCIAKRLLAQPHGPVGYLGASRIAQPYGLALLGKHLLSTLLVENITTVGEALDEAKRRVLMDTGIFRQQVDGLAALIYGSQTLEGMRQDVVRQYNFLGDPALRLRRPKQLQLTVTPQTHGTHVEVRAPFAQGKVRVSFARGLGEPAGALPDVNGLTKEALQRAWEQRYRAANARDVWSWEGELSAGSVTTDAPEPAPGVRWVRALAWGAEGAACGSVRIGAKMAASAHQFGTVASDGSSR
jgi:hypothetical protein